MEFITKGKQIHSDRRIPLFLEEQSRILNDHSSTFRLIVIEEGSIIIDLNSTPYFIEAPAIFCINNEDILTVNNSENIRIKTVYFKPEIINTKFGESILSEEEVKELSYTEYQDYVWLFPFIDNNELNGRYIKLGPSSLDRILRSFNQLRDELDNQYDGYWPCRSRSYFLEALFLVQNMRTTYDVFKSTITDYIGELKDIMLFIHTHYMEDITISVLVEKFGINRTKLNSIFMEITGKTVIKYLIDLRIKLACLILRDTLKPIKEVAYQTGFKDITHFGRTFKKNIDLSPTQYREKFNWMV